MPAVTPEDPLALPRVEAPAGALDRPVLGVVDAPTMLEGE